MDLHLLFADPVPALKMCNKLPFFLKFKNIFLIDCAKVKNHGVGPNLVS